VPEDAGVGDLAGNPIVWSLTVFPVLVVCLLINIVWLTMIVLGGRRGRGWRSIGAWLLVIISWVLVNRLDFYNINHGSSFSRGNVAPPTVPGHLEKK
jgi:hypothetical protein